jgi:hypothetical protein
MDQERASSSPKPSASCGVHSPVRIERLSRCITLSWPSPLEGRSVANGGGSAIPIIELAVESALRDVLPTGETAHLLTERWAGSGALELPNPRGLGKAYALVAFVPLRPRQPPRDGVGGGVGSLTGGRGSALASGDSPSSNTASKRATPQSISVLVRGSASRFSTLNLTQCLKCL